jgi:hypothetical protein
MGNIEIRIFIFLDYINFETNTWQTRFNLEVKFGFAIVQEPILER